MKKPRNYYCHRTPTSLPTSLPQNYEVLDKIGEGAFGQVYKIFNRDTSNIEVMKCGKGEHQTILKQTQIMMTMNTSDGFAKMKENSDKNNDMIIMSLLGQNLGKIIERGTINVIDMKRIAYQCLLRLKELHSRGFVHRDIKPENILLGNKGNPHKIYIVDFGLAGKYSKVLTKARKCYNSQMGTIKFCPIASHLGLQQFPKDDLESLGYVLIFLLENKLPWCSYPRGLKEGQRFELIKNMKQETDVNVMCSGVSCLKRYFKQIKELVPGMAIDYDKLAQIFKINCKEYCCYSFCPKNCQLSLKQTGKENQPGQEQISEEQVRISSQILSEREENVYDMF